MRCAQPAVRRGRDTRPTLLPEKGLFLHAGLPLQVRRLQESGAAQLDHPDRQGQREVPPHLQGPDPRFHRPCPDRHLRRAGRKARAGRGDVQLIMQ